MAHITSWTHGKSQEWDQKMRRQKPGLPSNEAARATETSLLMEFGLSVTRAPRWLTPAWLYGTSESIPACTGKTGQLHLYQLLNNEYSILILLQYF